MGTGAITGYIDVAQLTLYGFWIFFAGLIYYLHREDKREGYPLESDRSGGRIKVQGWPAIPRPKTFLLRSGATVTVPNFKVSSRPIPGAPLSRHLGAPLEPTGDPMGAGIGPGAWADRADVPDLTVEDEIRIVPLRVAPGFSLSRHDPDPRGKPVLGADGRTGGTVVDVWVDRAEGVVRYLEVEVPAAAGGAARRAMLPINFTRIGSGRVTVRSILGRQFAGVPALKKPDQITLLEEDMVMAYYGGGVLYATPQRQEPLL